MTDKGHWEWNDEVGPRGNLREAVCLFDSEDDMQAAIEDLESHGFSNAAISRPVPPEQVKSKLDHVVENVKELEDDASVPRQAYMDKDSNVEGVALLFMVPVYIALMIAGGIIAANGLALWHAIGIFIMLGSIGAAGGGFFAYRMAMRRILREKAEKAWGGLLLWVRTGSSDQEDRALQILRRNAGRDVHLHGPKHVQVH
ncbi:MAG: hypothetical protein COB37_11020 [Kordiimonadales bacterium]|nr:MAG: hypothetical protein COB37_11020 [Kordiimonadales bacterium]